MPEVTPGDNEESEIGSDQWMVEVVQGFGGLEYVC